MCIYKRNENGDLVESDGCLSTCKNVRPSYTVEYKMELTHIRDNSITTNDLSIKNYQISVEAALPNVIALDIHLINTCQNCNENVSNL